jgi:CarD family transcriptional regulator
MTLGSQRPRSDSSDQIHPAPAGSSEETDRSRPPAHNRTRFGFRANDFVVYPAHGVGQIVAIEEQTVAGASLEFFIVYFAKTKMTLRVPTPKAANLGMRKLSDPTVIEHVRRTLSKAPYKARGNWSRLAQEYESKIKSGDMIAIAEVTRDLYRPATNQGQSYSEQQLYAVALDRLAGEVAVVQQITEKEVIAELESILLAGRTQTRTGLGRS